MLKYIVAFLAVVGLFAVNGESIVSIEVNIPDGLVYALSENNTLYEIWNGEVDRTHIIDYPSPPAFASSFLYENNNGKVSLFQATSDIVSYYTNVIRLNLPFRNKPHLTPSPVSPNAYGWTRVPTTFDSSDKIALTISNGNFINLFSLNTLNLTDSERLYTAQKNSGTAVSYNNKNNRAVVFLYSFYQSSRRYNMYIREYLVSGANLVQVDTTFETLQNSPNYPFNNSVMNYAEFDSTNNAFWALDSKTPRMVRFNAQNLSSVTIIPLPGASFADAVGQPVAIYNFASQLAYVFSEVAIGFRLTEVDLYTKTVRRTKDFNTGATPVATAKLNVVEGKVYVGLQESSPASTPRILIITLADLSSTTLSL